MPSINQRDDSTTSPKSTRLEEPEPSLSLEADCAELEPEIYPESKPESESMSEPKSESECEEVGTYGQELKLTMSHRYSLRNRVKPPERLMKISSG